MTHPHNAKLQRFFSSSQIAFKKILSTFDPFVPSLLNFLSPWLLLGLQQSSDLWENGWVSSMSMPARMINLASMPGRMLARITKCLLWWRLGELKSFQIQGVQKLCPVTLRGEDDLANQLAPIFILNNWIVAVYCIPAAGPETQYLDRRKQHI